MAKCQACKLPVPAGRKYAGKPAMYCTRRCAINAANDRRRARGYRTVQSLVAERYFLIWAPSIGAPIPKANLDRIAEIEAILERQGIHAYTGKRTHKRHRNGGV